MVEQLDTALGRGWSGKTNTSSLSHTYTHTHVFPTLAFHFSSVGLTVLVVCFHPPLLPLPSPLSLRRAVVVVLAMARGSEHGRGCCSLVCYDGVGH